MKSLIFMKGMLCSIGAESFVKLTKQNIAPNNDEKRVNVLIMFLEIWMEKKRPHIIIKKFHNGRKNTIYKNPKINSDKNFSPYNSL